MSIAGTLSSALSGLTVNARAAEIAASNIANATTEGYGRRELMTNARALAGVGQGAQVSSVYRHYDQALVNDRRLAEAGAGDRGAQADFLTRLEGALGTSDDPRSLSGQIAAFDTALIEAGSRPESEARLSRVADTARGIVSHLSATSREVQQARSAADDQIEAQVAQLNSALTRVAEMNGQIRTSLSAGRDASGLMDQRQQAIDSVARIIPIREVAQEGGQVVLFSAKGALLADGRAFSFGFTPVGVITPDMTLGSGALSGLTLNGKALTTSGPQSQIAGGSLAGQFAVRDELAPGAQVKLDALARDLIGRFAAPGLDATRQPGDAGLFTDAGAAFDGTSETGLAQRISLNAAADPRQGGALWRLRDGLGAASPGASGNAQLLIDLETALTAARDPVSGGFMAGARSYSALASDVASGVARARLTAEGEVSYAQARVDSLHKMELDAGVDTDRELQTLLMIEQAYAANARVVQTVDRMIQTLLEM